MCLQFSKTCYIFHSSGLNKTSSNKNIEIIFNKMKYWKNVMQTETMMSSLIEICCNRWRGFCIANNDIFIWSTFQWFVSLNIKILCIIYIRKTWEYSISIKNLIFLSINLIWIGRDVSLTTLSVNLSRYLSFF